MTLLEFLGTMRRRWAYLVVPLILGCGLGTAAFMFATPTYQSSASVYFSVPMATSGGDLAQGGDYTQAQLASYAELATKPIVLEPVIKSLNLNTTPTKLAGFVSVTVTNDTVLTTITVTNTEPKQAAVIANAIADELGSTVRRLSPKSAQGDPVVDFAIAGRAAVPNSPSSPKKKIDLGGGFLAGLIIGVVAALARDRLDTRVRDEAQLDGLPPLGRIPFDRSAAKRGRSPLIVDWREGSERAEAFRKLRTALQFIDVDQPMQVIAVTSSAAAEGKSGVTANLAVAFAEAGYRVLLIDADLRRPSIADYFGVEGSVGLTNVLARHVDSADVIQPWGSTNRLSIMAAGPVPPNPSEILGSSRMRHLLAALRSDYDIVLIDTPPLLPVTDAAVVSVNADGVVVIARHGRTKRPALAQAVNALTAVDANVVGVVINRVPRNRRRNGYNYYRAVGAAGAPALLEAAESLDVERTPEHAANGELHRTTGGSDTRRTNDELAEGRVHHTHAASAVAH